MRLTMIKIRWSWDCIIFNMGIHILMRHIYIEMAPWSSAWLSCMWGCFTSHMAESEELKLCLLCNLQLAFKKFWVISEISCATIHMGSSECQTSYLDPDVCFTTMVLSMIANYVISYYRNYGFWKLSIITFYLTNVMKRYIFYLKFFMKS